MKYALAIHGGAGTITRSIMTSAKEVAYLDALKNTLTSGEDILKSGGTAMDAITQAVISLENCDLFNAGKGSVYTHEGFHEMDASIMDGQNLKAGAVGLIRNTVNPVLLARTIMENSEHVFLCGEGAEKFGREHGIKLESNSYFDTELRHNQWQEALKEDKIVLDHTINKDKKFGTVGAVARDCYGNLAAATSTGGMTNKRWGRIGDTPMIGAGTYADNESCAVSCTGHGEFFIRGVVAYDVACLIKYQGLTLQQACEKVILEKQVKLGGEGGLIAISQNHNPTMVFNSEGMYRASTQEGENAIIEIYGTEVF